MCLQTVIPEEGDHLHTVIPAEAGIYGPTGTLDPRFRGDDEKGGDDEERWGYGASGRPALAAPAIGSEAIRYPRRRGGSGVSTDDHARCADAYLRQDVENGGGSLGDRRCPIEPP